MSLEPPLHDSRAHHSAPNSPVYARRRPEESILYAVVRRELETFLAEARSRGQPVPRFVEQELRAYLRCGELAFG